MTLSPTTCRICLQTDSRTTNIFSTYSPPDGSATAASAISRYAFVQVLQDDGLPQGICNVCQNELHRTLLFIKLCEKSDKKLRTNCQPQDKFSDVDEPPAPAQLVQIKEIPPILTVCSQVEETKPEQTVIIKEEYNPAEEEGVQNEEFEKEFYNDISKAMENKEEHLNFVDVKDIQEDVDMSSDEGMLEEQNFEEEGHASGNLEMQCSSPRTVEEANKTPSKSAKKYFATYQQFIQWCNEENITEYSENVLLDYFNYGQKEKKWKSATMWCRYSMIKSQLINKQGVDIGKFLKLRAFLKKCNKGYRAKKSRAFNKEQLERFLCEAPDDVYLGMKIVLLIGVSGACNCEELIKITIDDIKDMGNVILFKIPDSRTRKLRCFKIFKKTYIKLYRTYASLRPKDFTEKRFFLKYKNGKCFRSVMGIHNLSGTFKKVAEYLKLSNPEQYTGHCLRRTSANLLIGGEEFIKSRPGLYKKIRRIL